MLLKVIAHGMVAEPGYPDPPNDLPVWLEQVIGSPCHWLSILSFGGNNWQISLDIATSRMTYYLMNPYDQYAFRGELAPCILGPFINGPPIWHPAAMGGTVNILGETPEYVLELAVEMNFQPGLRALYDDIPAADPARRCIRLTGRVSQGSCLFLFEP